MGEYSSRRGLDPEAILNQWKYLRDDIRLRAYLEKVADYVSQLEDEARWLREENERLREAQRQHAEWDGRGSLVRGYVPPYAPPAIAPATPNANKHHLPEPATAEHYQNVHVHWVPKAI